MSALTASSRKPFLLLLNGAIHTLDPARPLVSALAVDLASGRIIATGETADIRRLAGPLTETIDLGGRTVTPGFTDAHTHLVHYAQARLDVDLRGAASEGEAVAQVAERAARTPAGTWIVGRGWDANAWPGQRFPARQSLDAAVPEHPVALWHHDHHSLWASSRALALAGVTHETADPHPGRIGHDHGGEPDGMLYEDATALVAGAITPPGEDALRRELDTVQAELLARGITGVHNIEDSRSLRLLQRMRATGALRLRVLYYIPRRSLPAALELGLQADHGDDWLRFAGIKVYMDGALGSHTAAMLDPYEGEPGNLGMLTTTADEAEALVRSATAGGIGLAIHAIGDRAVHAALDGIEAVTRSGDLTLGAPGNALPLTRVRLEHVQLASEADIARMAALGVVASVQPFHAVVDRDTAERYWGTRHRRAYAYQRMRTAGIPLALGSDVPVDTPDPLRIIHAAVSRTSDETPERPAWLPDEALSVRQAIWGYTQGAAWAGGQEARLGSLQRGKLADLVVFDEDPFMVPADRLATLPIAATIVGGQVAHGSLS